MLFLLAGGYFPPRTNRASFWQYAKPAIVKRDDLALIVMALVNELEA